jgi:hypothetical protein
MSRTPTRPFPRYLPQNVRQALSSTKNYLLWKQLCDLYGGCVKCGQSIPWNDLKAEIICDPKIPTSRVCLLRLQPMCSDCARITHYRHRWCLDPYWMVDRRPGGWVRVFAEIGDDALILLSAHPIPTTEPEVKYSNRANTNGISEYILE